ncbi:MAG: acyl carrier protein [Sandaracinaceae bacterium]|nr:acyl carrier protein [Sandaracinaceae bacterium]
MDKAHIKNVVLKHLGDSVEGLDPATVDTSLSMKDLGANSLDIVEVVSSSMRELKVKIPRSELAKLTNVDELVDLLHEVAAAKLAS